MDNCKHEYEVRAQAAYCPKCLEWAHLAAALRYTNKRLTSTETENEKMVEAARAVFVLNDCSTAEERIKARLTLAALIKEKQE